MIPSKGKVLRLVEQLAPVLPGPAKDVVRAALGIGKVSARVEAAPHPSWATCMAKPGVMPDLAALLGRGGKERRPGPQPGTGAGTFTARSLATPVGPLSYKLFQPTGVTPPKALIVLLHGCTQDADDFAAGTGMNAIAQRENVLVAYPEQSRGANMSRCWNWFMAANQRRGHGEAAAIAAVIQALMTEHAIEPGRVFVAGLSAGGAMAAIMAETYPELFGAVGIHSGLAFGAAHDMASAFSAMRHGGPSVPAETGTLAAGVPTIVFHGDADTTVDPSNAAAIVARFTARETGLAPSTERGQTANGRAFTRSVGRDATGRVRFESWLVQGAGHAWSGGSAAGTYTDPKGPDASAVMMRFFFDQIDAVPAAA